MRPQDRSPKFHRSSRRHERGQGLVEYGLILILVGMVALAGLRFLGQNTASGFCSTSNGLNGGSPATLSCQIIYVSDSTTQSILEFQGGSTGTATPVRSIAGAATGLSGVAGVALDSAGNLYVANSTGGGGSGSVTIYSPGASGNVAPIHTITTGTSTPANLTFDQYGTLYVLNQNLAQYGASVTEYPSPLTATAPSITLSGSNTRMEPNAGNPPVGLVVGPDNTLYVENPAPLILEFPFQASGNQGYTTFISGGGMTAFVGGIAMDASGVLYASDPGWCCGPGNGRIKEFTVPANTTLRTLTNVVSLGMAFDRNGTLYTTAGNTMTEFAAGASGVGAPTATLTGPSGGYYAYIAIR